MKTTPTPEQIEEVLRLYKDGMRLKDIVAKTGLSMSKLNYYIYDRYRAGRNLADKVPKTITLSEEKVNRIIVLATFGYSDGEIAEDIRIKRQYVENEVIRLKEMNRIKSSLKQINNGS